IDLCVLREEEKRTEAERITSQEASGAFDLEQGPLLRVRLIRMGEREHIGLVNMHHIVSDGWSMGVLIREIGALYEAYSEGRESPLEELEIQYADYAAWQKEWLSGEALDREMEYWRKQLEGAPELLDLPTDRARPAAQSYRGSSEYIVIPEES